MTTNHPNQQPWLNHRAWLPENLCDNTALAAKVMIGFALLWNAISWPFVPEVIRETSQGDVAKLFFLLFPLTGIALAVWAFRLWQRARRFGRICLIMDPYPGAIGGELGGYLVIPRRALPARHAAKIIVTIACHHHRRRNKDTDVRLIWQAEGYADQQLLAEGLRVQFRFVIPNGLPQSEIPARDYHAWTVNLITTHGEPDIKFSFNVPVFFSTARSTLNIMDSTTHNHSVEARLNEIDRISDEAMTTEGYQWIYHRGRHGGTGWMLLLIGAIFAGGSYLLSHQSAPMFFTAISALVAFGLLLGGFYTTFNRLVVRWRNPTLTIYRTLFGLPLIHQAINTTQIKHLTLIRSYSSTNGAHDSVVYSIKMQLTDGRHYLIADALRGRETAQMLMEELARRCQLYIVQNDKV